MDNRKETVEKIITALTNRSGFNDLWYNLDEEIQTEITDEIVNILPIHSVMLSYNDWAEECKKHLDTKPHVKNRWKDSTFKKCYKEGMTPKQAAGLCWLASY